MNAADAGALKSADGVHGMDGVAIAGAGVAEDGQVDRFGNALGDLHLLGKGHQRLGNGEMRTAHIAAHIDGVKAQRLHQPGGHRVVSTGGDDGFASGQPRFQVGLQGHFTNTSGGAGFTARPVARPDGVGRRRAA